MWLHGQDEWRLQEVDIDSLAVERCWEKIPMPQISTVSYQRDGMRLTCNLVNGKVEVTFQVPMQGVFRQRRIVHDTAAMAALFDILPQLLLLQQGYHMEEQEEEEGLSRNSEKRKVDLYNEFTKKPRLYEDESSTSSGSPLLLRLS
jgi:hypothetical protein